jgi:hypothetical protein
MFLALVLANLERSVAAPPKFVLTQPGAALESNLRRATFRLSSDDRCEGP